MTDDDTPAPADPPAPNSKRAAWEAQMEANCKRALELLATQRSASVEVRGRWSGFKRGRPLVRRVR